MHFLLFCFFVENFRKKDNSHEYLDFVALKSTISLGNRTCSTNLRIFPIEIICFHCTEGKTNPTSHFTVKGACKFFINNFQTVTKIATSFWCSLVYSMLVFFQKILNIFIDVKVYNIHMKLYNHYTEPYCSHGRYPSIFACN